MIGAVGNQGMFYSNTMSRFGRNVWWAGALAGYGRRGYDMRVVRNTRANCFRVLGIISLLTAIGFGASVGVKFNMVSTTFLRMGALTIIPNLPLGVFTSLVNGIIQLHLSCGRTVLMFRVFGYTRTYFFLIVMCIVAVGIFTWIVAQSGSSLFGSAITTIQFIDFVMGIAQMINVILGLKMLYHIRKDVVTTDSNYQPSTIAGPAVPGPGMTPSPMYQAQAQPPCVQSPTRVAPTYAPDAFGAYPNAAYAQSPYATMQPTVYSSAFGPQMSPMHLPTQTQIPMQMPMSNYASAMPGNSPTYAYYTPQPQAQSLPQQTGDVTHQSVFATLQNAFAPPSYDNATKESEAS